jgi:hypothetical protein
MSKQITSGFVAWIAAVAFLLQAELAFSGIMLDGVPAANYVNFSNQSQFDAIGRFASGVSGTLIAPNWVLTAGHVGPGTGFQVRGAGPVYGIAETIKHPTFLSNGGDINFGFDLQLVRLQTSVLGITPASIYRSRNEVGQTAAITGFGYGGVGSTGATLGTAQRAGTNVLDAVVNFENSGSKVGAQAAMLVADFDSARGAHNTLGGFFASSPTPAALEYHLAGFDSGGGVFVFEGGRWFLAGVNSGVASQNQVDPGIGQNTNLFGYGAVSFLTRVSSFTGFIDSHITAVPEPTSLALVGLAGGLAGGLTAGRRLYKRKTDKRA